VVSDRRIMVVDDDPTVSEIVVKYLERDGFVVSAVPDGREALERARVELPELVVLDLMLPEVDGFEVCRQLRELAPIPVVMLSARGDEQDRIMGLELGADDYLAKPFSPRELSARVSAVLRRASDQLISAQAEPLDFGRIVVDRRAREVQVDGGAVMLTAKEFDLLEFFATHTRQVFRRDQLLEQVWGYTIGDTATVTVHVRRVREKIERDPSAPEHLVTAWGVGYRFDP
jgi:DNA-binding response OmpR family regulator